MYKFVAHDNSGVPYQWTVERRAHRWRVRIWTVHAARAEALHTSTTGMGEPFIDETLDSIEAVEKLLGSRDDRTLRGAARNLVDRMRAGETFA